MNEINDTSNTSITEQNECILTDEEIRQAYNMNLHIVSVFVLLVVSLLGASFSVASTRVKRLHVSPVIINTGKFFGSGVILATGFVHILPEAMEALSDSCLPESWNVYGAYGGLFAMLSALGMQLIEFLAHQRYRTARVKHAHLTKSHDHRECIKQEQTPNEPDISTSTGQATYDIENREKAEDVTIDVDQSENAEQNNNTVNELESVEQINETTGKRKKKKKKPINGEIHTNEPVNQVNNIIEESPEITEPHVHKDIIAIEVPHIEPNSIDVCETSAHYHGAAFQDDGHQHKISTYLLEFGIALHSVLIGLTLGTATDTFVPLFIALCFHQFFEAIALGAQIANLKTTSLRPAITMITFFSLTTPVGIAIGIGIHSGTYNPKSVSSLLVTGILESLSAGILIYVALVNLINAEMGSNAHAFYSLKTRLKFLYFIALYLGVAAMAIIGRWA